MSYEARGDDDDGRDGYREQLIDAGWLTAEDAAELRKELEQERAARKQPGQHIDDCGVVQSPGGPCTCVEDARELNRRLRAAERVVEQVRTFLGPERAAIALTEYDRTTKEDGSRAGGAGGKTT